MHVQTYGLSFSISHLTKPNAFPKTLIFPRNSFTAINSLENSNFMSPPVNSRVKRKWNRDSGFQLNGVLKMNFHSWRMRKRRAFICSISEGPNSITNAETKRKVVEHISLLKAKEDLSVKDEKDMLDFLYTSQYQMGGVVAISLGRLSDENLGSYTHAVFMRFQRREDLENFYENPYYLGVLKDRVTPYCHELTYVDYESEVEDDILPIFRKGEEFNFGVEFILLVQFAERSLGGAAEDALASLAKLSTEFPSLIVQVTQGLNFNCSSKEYTHGVVIRFRSSEALKIFMSSSEYMDIWTSKFEPIIQMVLPINFSVDPVGTELM